MGDPMSNMKRETTSDHSLFAWSTFLIVEQEVGFVLVISNLPCESAADCREPHASFMAPLLPRSAIFFLTLSFMKRWQFPESTCCQYSIADRRSNISQHLYSVCTFTPVCMKQPKTKPVMLKKKKGPEVNRVSTTALLTPSPLPHAGCCDL